MTNQASPLNHDHLLESFKQEGAPPAFDPLKQHR